MYPLDEVDVPLHKTLPKGAPAIAFHDTSDSLSPWVPLPDAKIRETRRAYRAAISFMDHNVGVVLEALQASRQAPQTAVLYHADHGYVS